MRIAEAPMKIEIKAECTGGCYCPDLAAYPHLVYAPRQWGEGVRIASNGVDALAVAAAAEQAPTQTVAKAYNISVVEVLDARRWAHDTD